MNQAIKALCPWLSKGNYPTKYYIGSGTGTSKYRLVAFDNALIDCGISEYNLVRVSSILPMNATKVTSVDLKKGSPLLTAYGRMESNIPGQLISSAVGAAIPPNKNSISIIMEYAGACSEKESKQIVREMIKEAMINHSIPYEKIITSSIEAAVPESGEFTSVISSISFW